MCKSQYHGNSKNHAIKRKSKLQRENIHDTVMKSDAAAAAKSLQSCPTLCDPIDGSPPGSPVPGILQARTLECVAISFSNAWERKVKVKSLSRVRLFTTPKTAAHQDPLSMGFARQEYWSGVPSPSPIKSDEWTTCVGGRFPFFAFSPWKENESKHIKMLTMVTPTW